MIVERYNLVWTFRVRVALLYWEYGSQSTYDLDRPTSDDGPGLACLCCCVFRLDCIHV
jgi:hypothetical protein